MWQCRCEEGGGRGETPGQDAPLGWENGEAGKGKREGAGNCRIGKELKNQPKISKTFEISVFFLLLLFHFSRLHGPWPVGRQGRWNDREGDGEHTRHNDEAIRARCSTVAVHCICMGMVEELNISLSARSMQGRVRVGRCRAPFLLELFGAPCEPWTMYSCVVAVNYSILLTRCWRGRQQTVRFD